MTLISTAPTVHTTDITIIGAGVIGLALAARLAHPNREVLILEAQSTFGSVTSSRNSEVIHAGLYYPSGSLKARLCVQGREQLLAYARERHIDHRLCGKLVVATEESEIAAIQALHQQALANGVQGLQMLNASEVQALEPQLKAVAALHSSATGILDSHAFMTSLLAQAQDGGAQLAVCSPVLGGQVCTDGQIELQVGGTEPMRLKSRLVINAAGLNAGPLARAIQGLPVHSIPEAHFCKGHYFSLQSPCPFQRLIYPVHTAAGLGTHLTLDLAGRGRFGPDVQWLAGVQASAEGASIDYRVDEGRADAFERDIRRYWPGLPPNSLAPAYSGVRPKIVGPGQPAADFQISTAQDHGVPAWVGLYGIESPGLTASLALAEEVARRVRALDAGQTRPVQLHFIN